MDLKEYVVWFLSCCAQLVATFWLLSGSACAVETDGVNINAVRMVSSSSTSASIEVEYSLDTNHRMATVVGLAYSDDGTKMTQRGSSAPVVGPGRNAKVLITVKRPAEPSEHVTHKLLVTFHVVETMTRFRRSFDLSIKWPEVSEIGSQSASAQYIFDTSALNWISRNYLIEEDFVALDNLLTQWNDSSKRDIDGEWKLSHFTRGLQEEFQDKNWKINSERLRQWRLSSPKSIALALTEASYWLTYGNSVLGSEYRQSTDAFARKLAKERLRKGEKVLLDAKRYAANCPVWYEIFIAISAGLQRDDHFMQRLFAEAITKHPTYSQIYIAMNKYLAPVSKLQVAWDAVDDVIAKGVRNTQTIEGNIGYANLYLAITYSRMESFNLLRDTLASWPKLRTAMAERAKRFPSPSNLNELAGYACIAEDSAAYLKVRPQVIYIVPEVWRSNYSADLCDRRFLKFL